MDSAKYEYRLSWECPSAACVMAHQNVAWEGLTDDEWAALPWEPSYRIADGGDIFPQRHDLEGWAEYHYQPVRNVRFERRVRDPDEGWDEVAVRGATGVTHWKTTHDAASRVSSAPAICGVVCACGSNGEPLACGYEPHEDGPHSWATLPTFGGNDA